MQDYLIAEALNSVAKKTLELYIKGELGRKSALQILVACRQAMLYDYSPDSEWNDAVECLEGYCGHCLEPFGNKKEYALPPEGLPAEELSRFVKVHRDSLARWVVCSKCYNELLAQFKKDN